MIDPLDHLVCINQPFQDNETPIKILESEAQVIFPYWQYFMHMVNHNC